MDREKLKELYQYYSLQPSDIFTKNVGGKSFTIIKRQGIEKIQSKEAINISYDVIKCETNFAVIKANAYVSHKPNDHIETFGSALKGSKYNDGNCMNWYVAEMAEKRALSRAVLKLTGFYELGVMGEDESDDFKETKSN